MTTRFRLIHRGIRGGMFYCVDKNTGKRTSLHTTDRDEAQQVIDAKNQAERQPVLNLQIAKAYLAGTDNGMATRRWQNAIEALTNTKLDVNQHRWQTAAKAFTTFGACFPLPLASMAPAASGAAARVLCTGNGGSPKRH